MRHRNGHDRMPIVRAEKLFDRVPPHSIEAEAAVLGSMILDWRCCGEVLQIFEPGAGVFYDQKHAAIYEALVDLYDKEQNIDMVLLNERLRDKKLLDGVGGVEYLIEMAEGVPSSASVGYYAKIVRDKYLVRRKIEICVQHLWRAYEDNADADEQLDKLEADVFAIAQASIKHENTQAMGELVDEVLHELETNDGRLVTGVETGFFELDEMLCGLQKGDFIIVAARPSMGKSAMMSCIAEHIGATNKQPVAIFSLEMNRKQIAQRMLCSRANVSSHNLRRNMLSGDQFTRLALAQGELSGSPIQVDDTPALTLLQLRAKSRRMVDRLGVVAIFVDYIQLMTDPTAAREGRQQEVSTISRGLKALARELRVPVVALSQLNRKAEERGNNRPRMSDLRESGSLEQDADVVLLLHREDYYHRGEEGYQETNVAEVIVEKQRMGPTGIVKLGWDAATTRFNNLATTQGGLYR